MKVNLIVPLFLGLLQFTLGGHYLFYLPFSSKSIKLGFMPMAKELAHRGHQITIVCPHKEKKAIPGITEIIHASPFDDLSNEVTNIVLRENGTEADLPVWSIIEATITANREALSHPDLQTILSDDSIKVDVVMAIPMLGNEAAYYVAHKKNASLVGFVSIPFLPPWMAAAVGNPINPSYMPLMLFPFGQVMSLKERLINTVGTTAVMLGRKYYALPRVADMIAEVYPQESALDLDDLSKNTALVINHGSPFTGDGLRPTLPNTIQAGLMSCFPGSPLEGELKEWVEGAEHGVIYLSFGSVVKASKMPESRRQLLIAVLSQLKQRIIWKWETEMVDLPPNVKAFAWLPQTSVLAHPNVKLFVTHGGAGSVQETICYKTPIVGIPLGGDQVTNLAEAELKHLGAVIPWREVTQQNLLHAINQVLEDPSYQESVNRLQNLIMDVPVHPRDTAVWWLEYLLRHPHNPGMRSPVLDMNFATYMLLDVMAVLATALVLVLLILKKLIGMCCGSKQKKKKD